MFPNITKKETIMAQDTPDAIEERNRHVAEWKVRQAEQKHQQAAILAAGQKAALDYLKKSNFHAIISRVAHKFDPLYKASKWDDKTITPLGGMIIAGHLPVFVIEPIPGLKTKTGIPGYNYEIKLGPGKPVFTIAATICQEEDEVYYVVSVIKTDGLTHESKEPINLDSRSKTDLETWLHATISHFESSKNTITSILFERFADRIDN